MASVTSGQARWGVGWAVLTLVCSIAVVRYDIADRRAAFQSEARAAHRLLSQRAAQHDAILATLVLMDAGPSAQHPSARLPALYPQVLVVWRRSAGERWSVPTWTEAEARSLAAGHAVLASVDPTRAHFDVVRAGDPTSFAMRIDIEAWIPWTDWPVRRDGSTSVELALATDRILLEPGRSASAWHGGVTPGFRFSKALDTPSQPFVLHLQRSTGPVDWPWARLAMVAALSAAICVVVATVWRQRERRRRAEQLLRVHRAARLNALGQFAAGIAHELNQPLTAVMASTQAARRMLDEDPPHPLLQEALTQASGQARRAADVVGRLRRQIEQSGHADEPHPVVLGDAVRAACALLAPELSRLGIKPRIDDHVVTVLADPVALEQILHNLLSNALQAMVEVPAAQRGLTMTIRAEAGRGVLCLRDGGPGLPADVLAHLFEPFVGSRSLGLGLGLSLCESLASAMGGTLSGRNHADGGAEFRLELPIASTP